MKVDRWLDLFRNNGNKKLFSLSDLVLLSGEEKRSVSVQLNRLVKSEIVKRPVRGWYENPFKPPTNEELSMVIRHPSYLSMEYALSRQGILSQRVFTYTSVTTKLPYTYRRENLHLEYHQIKRSLFWGYESEGGVLVAEPEKALLDLIYIRLVRTNKMNRTHLASLIDDMYLDELDNDRLEHYTEEFDRVTRGIVFEMVLND